ncbi:uncharacterized protein EV420DRAFT_1649751 [Desarmillaria tabescens]|uniref:Uncharacterized protein n=1 Tax=Armillaria tabescens TaxID=1929756 RepID=A0AA39JKR8_ARMTA|nr:uncharacterized protein EV420DRAFT_1649751 [Desarmillaria tabescens]KAK0442273.1 hypothetical protein EV420DRAFT_1649751 [Desarmillaria tabescens]
MANQCEPDADGSIRNDHSDGDDILLLAQPEMTNTRIKDLTNHLLESIRAVGIDRESPDVAKLLKDLTDYTTLNTQLLISIRADHQRMVQENLLRIDELELKERYIKQVLAGRRRAKRACRDAEERLAHIWGQVDRLWAQVNPTWRKVKEELACHVCFRKLWWAVTYTPSSHPLSPCCTYEWFQQEHAFKENPAYTCIRCHAHIQQAPIHAFTVENAVRELLRLDEDDRQLAEDMAREAGYVDKDSWIVFFP